MNVPGMGHMPQVLAGDIRVKDFEWPAMLAGGVAWRPTPDWLIALDVRQVFWADVMKNFNLGFVASTATSNSAFAGKALDAQLYQSWKDQTVVQLGASYALTQDFTLRFGFNHGADPIPDQNLNCLFPATVENHLTLGCGWMISPNSSIDLSYTHGFSHSVTNGGGVTVKHAQNNVQLAYAHRF